MNRVRLFPVAILVVVVLLGQSPLSFAGNDDWLGGPPAYAFASSSPGPVAFFAQYEADNARCFAARFSYRVPSDALAPWVMSVASYGQNRGWAAVLTESDEEPPETNRIVVTAGNMTLLRHEEAAPPTGPTSLIGESWTFPKCADEFYDGVVTYFLVTNAPTTTASLELWAYEDVTLVDGFPPWIGHVGNASANLIHFSESADVFFYSQRDFRGIASAERAPIEVVGGVAGAAGVQKVISPRSGLMGTFLDFGSVREASLLSYERPDGAFGFGSDTNLLPTMEDILHVTGPPGEWTFHAHAYAAAAPSSLYLWGADIDTGGFDEPPIIERAQRHPASVVPS